MTARLPEPSELPPPVWPPAPAAPAAARASRTRRYTVIGLAAGMLGGGTVGLAATLPSASLAAGEPPVVTVDDTELPAPAMRGQWVRTALQGLVDDGTLTAEQLDAVVAALDAARPAAPMLGHGPGHMRRGDHPHLLADREELAALLGIDADTLASELRSGTSLATLAEQHGVDVEAVIDLLVADAEARLADRAENIRERVTQMVTRE